MAAMMAQDGKKLRRIINGLLWLEVGCILLLGGCTLLPRVERGEAVEAEFEQRMPVGWEALGGWQPVNLDDDEDGENLLLFRFDGGQVGALIQEGELATTISQPQLLLPRYFDDQGGLGQGIIAAPGTPVEAIGLYPVEGNSPVRELVLLGRGTHLTFAWWKGEANGYGVTQLYAPGGFGVDWETWQEDPSPIESVMGYYPLEDYRARSSICNTILYTRRTDLPSELPTIIFSGVAQGLHFCNSTIPAHPFAPEGVVLAYLHWPRPANAGLDGLLTPGTTLPQLEAESAYERFPLERVEDIAAYTTVPMSQAQVESAQEQGDALAPTTAVCVEFAEKANPTLRRWVVFTLRYQPPDAAQRLPDRWTLSGALTEPPPMEPPPPGYCATILDRNAP